MGTDASELCRRHRRNPRICKANRRISTITSSARSRDQIPTGVACIFFTCLIVFFTKLFFPFSENQLDVNNFSGGKK